MILGGKIGQTVAQQIKHSTEYLLKHMQYPDLKLPIYYQKPRLHYAI
jgi:hypothetical protein